MKHSATLKVAVLSLLAAPLALASSDTIIFTEWAEPVYLSACGAILLAFGMIKGSRGEG